MGKGLLAAVGLPVVSRGCCRDADGGPSRAAGRVHPVGEAMLDAPGHGNSEGGVSPSSLSGRASGE